MGSGLGGKACDLIDALDMWFERGKGEIKIDLPLVVCEGMGSVLFPQSRIMKIEIYARRDYSNTIRHIRMIRSIFCFKSAYIASPSPKCILDRSPRRKWTFSQEVER